MQKTRQNKSIPGLYAGTHAQKEKWRRLRGFEGRFLIRSEIAILLVFLSLLNVAMAHVHESAKHANPNVAFYYQDSPPVYALQAFDIVVIDPARALPPHEPTPHTSWFARLDLRPGHGVQQLQTLIDVEIPRLWEQGFRGFLLDDGTQADTAGTEQAGELVTSVIDSIHAGYPGAGILLRNHLAVALTRSDALSAVVIDSLYQRPGGYGGLMARVAESTRTELLNRIGRLQAESGLPVIGIDYCAAPDKDCRRDLAQRLMRDGVQPYVTAPGAGTVGVGRIEIMPRKILVVQALPWNLSLEQSVGVVALSMPLNYLGYDVRYVDLNTQALPHDIGSDRYAGIVVALDQSAPRSGEWRQWLLARIHEGMRVAVVGHFGFSMDGFTAAALKLEGVPGSLPAAGAPQIVSQAGLIGYEAMPTPDVRYAVGVRAGKDGRSLLRLKYGDYLYDAAAMAPWGGYVLAPYGVISQDAITQYRWAIQPLEFLKQALALPDMPVPDVTSENGRRLMFTHVDGDGFPSGTEFSSAPNQFSAQVLHDRIITRYPIPMSMSVVEGEVGPAGLYPQLSPALESLARKIFALPNVEIASHTYSHPFFFSQIDNTTGRHAPPYHQTPEEEADPFSLDIPGYEFDLDREISGSIDYINQRLAPPGKKVEAIFWSGDAQAPAIALRKAAQAGVLNINSGSTVITKSKNSWTNIAPYGVAKGERPDEFQVYAATMNENVYTNDWLGPFYGFNRVLETFAMTDEPIRFKALNIYYHFYSATKKASLRALEEVFSSVMKQPVFPIYTTDYIRRVLQWRNVSIAREGERWIVRSGTDLRQLRWPGQAVPELATAQGIAGYAQGPGGMYIHMGSDAASFRMTTTGQKNLPYVREASGFIRHFQRDGRNAQFELGGYYKPFVELAGMTNCSPLSAEGIRQTRLGAQAWRLDLAGTVAKPVAYQTIRVQCE